MKDVSVVVDGTLLADCERLGNVRFGVARVAEEVTSRLLKDPTIELALANTRLSFEDDRFIRKYLSKQPPNRSTVISYPFYNTKVPQLERITSKLYRTYLPGIVPGLGNHDLFHSFYYPFSERVKRSKIKKCITLLDIIPLRMEGYGEVLPLMKSIVESIVPNFGIAISQFSKDDLCDYDRRIDPDRIFVAPLAANREIFHVDRSEESWKKVKVKYDLPDKYFLSISGVDKRKNLPHLMKAFEQLIVQQKVDDLYLVMTGNAPFEKTIFQSLNLSEKAISRIIFTKSIEEQDMSAVYSNAVCFFFMSLYEGFGLPALEAMQCGTPVISSNVTSLPEVVGDAGIVLNPTDGDDLSQAMWSVYKDTTLVNRLSAKGLDRAALFSWERCAKEYGEIFKKISN